MIETSQQKAIRQRNHGNKSNNITLYMYLFIYFMGSLGTISMSSDQTLHLCAQFAILSFYMNL